MTQQTAFFPLGGGLDLVTPAIALPPGRAINAVNYEPNPAGYRRVEGFERFDGRTSPTDAPFWQLEFDGGAVAFALNDTVTGATSSATGKVLAVPTLTAGAYGTSDAEGYLGLGGVTGTFVDGESLQVSGVTRAVAVGTTDEDVGPSDAIETDWQAQATENARALIAAVPGVGPVRGIWAYQGKKYAVRDHTGATEGRLYESSAAGWVHKTFGREIAFTSGGGALKNIIEGDTILGATSGAAATVQRVVVRSGSWAGGNAAGYLVLSGQTGTFAGENLNVGADTDVATIAGNSTEIKLPAGGRYDVVIHNFYGASNLLRVYGVNGVGRAFEFDGTVMAFITTGTPTDEPHRVAVHRKALLLGFPGGSNQLSVVGEPLSFNAVLGAAEIAIGDEITDYVPASAGATIILGANSVNVLYGNDSTDYQLETISDEAGALPWTADKVGQALYMDARGLRKISATQAYGNFNIGSLTNRISPLLLRLQRNRVLPVGSIRVRGKDQYRVFFDNFSGLAVYLGGKEPEILPFDLGKLVTCLTSAETEDGEELFFGSDDGFVYRLDKGTSFDGEPIPAYLQLPFNHMRSPQVRKRWHKVVLECDVSKVATIRMGAQFDYADPKEISLPFSEVVLRGGGGIWGLSVWGDFQWSAPAEGSAEAYIEGVGRNMSLVVASQTANDEPHLLQGVTLYYTQRGLAR